MLPKLPPPWQQQTLLQVYVWKLVLEDDEKQLKLLAQT